MHRQSDLTTLNELLTCYTFTLASAIAGNALDSFVTKGSLCPRRTIADWMASGVALLGEYKALPAGGLDEVCQELVMVPVAGHGLRSGVTAELSRFYSDAVMLAKRTMFVAPEAEQTSQSGSQGRDEKVARLETRQSMIDEQPQPA